MNTPKPDAGQPSEDRKIPPDNDEILSFAELNDYCGKDRKWNRKTDIYADGFMTGWSLAFERLPYKPESPEYEHYREMIIEAAKEIKTVKERQQENILQGEVTEGEAGGKNDGNPFNNGTASHEYWRRGYIACLNAAKTWQFRQSYKT